jgi:hypothetical protein
MVIDNWRLSTFVHIQPPYPFSVRFNVECPSHFLAGTASSLTGGCRSGHSVRGSLAVRGQTSQLRVSYREKPCGHSAFGTQAGATTGPIPASFNTRVGKDWRRGMTWSGILGKTAAGLGAVAVPMVFAVAGAGQASADPGVCVSGPWGYASACLNGPGWVDWGPHWDGGWDNGWRHGDDQGEDD